ncbi:MAG: ATP-binding protein [Acidobacteriia bacterium]|nr:ATP-binding protein [Terriglobia bacterium]
MKIEHMPTIEQLSKLFRALAQKDLDSAARLASVIAADEERKGHTTAAQLLQGALAQNGAQSVVERSAHASMNGTASLLSGALSERTGAVRLDDVVLRTGTRRILDDLVREFRGQGQLRACGIRRRSKLIFHGPPGCGKTLTALALANSLALPLYVVRFDAVVGSYLGQTATHLRQLFQFAESACCVLLFDEIDALGKRRGSPSDVGELDRIVIALMQELELSQIPGFVVATSNLPGSLDDALWRRFDLALRFSAPTKVEVTRFTRTKAKSFNVPLTKMLLANTSRLQSYADIEKAVEDAARRAALRDL